MLPMSTSSPASTPTRDSRIRGLQGQPRKLVRNSSLFGSIKNFVAAPFSRLFTGSSEEFDDEKDSSGKRRRYQNGIQNNSEAYEDGPAPAKRLRVGSPSLSPPPPASRSAYLDPPSSAFKRATSTSIYNPPSRATSITIPSTTISDTNARSTISPLRRQLSSGMSIDPHPTSATNPRPISRDVSMAAIPHASSGQQDAALQRPERLPSRDHSMPPLSSRPSFIMRNSMTPQPHPQRDVSEPPPMTSLSSYPVFVRGPSQTKEAQPKITTTLGSLVDSKRSVSSPSSRFFD
jgi:nucleoporin NUP1